MTVNSSALQKAVSGPQKIGGYSIDGEVLDSIKQAARATGVDFSYLMAKAAQESSFRPDIKASTSSATGLYQFLDSTWLWMVKEHGDKHGLAWASDQIQADGRGGFSVKDPGARQQILDLRKDPKSSALIGAEFAKVNKEHLERQLGRPAGPTEMYLAHFLGAGGATKFLQAVDRAANTNAADLMPQAAAANQSIFYDRDSGRPRTVADIYKLFQRSIEKKIETFGGLDGAVVASANEANRAAQAYATGAKSSGTAAASSMRSAGPGMGSGEATMGKLDGTPNVSLLFMLSLIEQDLKGPDSILGHGGDTNGETDAERQQRARKAYL